VGVLEWKVCMPWGRKLHHIQSDAHRRIAFTRQKMLAAQERTNYSSCEATTRTVWWLPKKPSIMILLCAVHSPRLAPSGRLLLPQARPLETVILHTNSSLVTHAPYSTGIILLPVFYYQHSPFGVTMTMASRPVAPTHCHCRVRQIQ